MVDLHQHGSVCRFGKKRQTEVEGVRRTGILVEVKGHRDRGLDDGGAFLAALLHFAGMEW